jgi:uncharacterized membrane protein required for colicin V production
MAPLVVSLRLYYPLGCWSSSYYPLGYRGLYSYICFAFLTFVVRILTFVVRILTFVVIIITFVVITKAKAKAKANAIVKIRTKVALGHQIKTTKKMLKQNHNFYFKYLRSKIWKEYLKFLTH